MHLQIVFLAAGIAFSTSTSPSGSKPLMVLTGVDSRAETSGFQRAESPAEFLELWKAHVRRSNREIVETPPPVLTIDFNRCSVVAIFQIEKRVSAGLRVMEVEERDDRVAVRYENLGISRIVRFRESPPPVEVSPDYAFIVLPKTNKTIVVEEDARQAKNALTIWKERARLPAKGQR